MYFRADAISCMIFIMFSSVYGVDFAILFIISPLNVSIAIKLNTKTRLCYYKLFTAFRTIMSI